MPSDRPPEPPDPQNLWQNQPNEPFVISIEEIRRRAERLHARARFSAFVRIAAGLALCFCFAWASLQAHALLTRLGWAILSLWSAYLAFHGYIWIRAGTRTGAPEPTSLESYRIDLETQHGFARRVWRKAGLAFCFLGLALVLGPPLRALLSTNPRLLRNAAPFFVLLAIWFAIFFPMRKRTLRDLQRQIDDLRSFMSRPKSQPGRKTK